MQITSLPQSKLPGGMSEQSSLVVRDSVLLSQNNLTVEMSGDGDSFLLSQTNTSFFSESIYSAGSSNFQSPGLSGPSSNNAPSLSQANSPLAASAKMQYLEVIESRVSILITQSAKQTGGLTQSLLSVTATQATSSLSLLQPIETAGFAPETASLLPEIESLVPEAEEIPDAEAAVDISLYSAENTADRIVQFALSFYEGGDREEFASMVKDAVMKGYEEARATLGGILPEESARTVELVYQALDNFAAREEINLTA